MPFADDLKKLARDAVADIGQTYQNMLWRDSGFAAPSQYGRTFDPRVENPVEGTPETIDIHVRHSFDDFERG